MRFISDILNTLSYLAVFFLVAPAAIKMDSMTINAALVFIAISAFISIIVSAVEYVNSAYHKTRGEGDE